MLSFWPRKYNICILISALCIFLILIPKHGVHVSVQIRRTVHCDVDDGSGEQKYLLFPMSTVIYGAGIGNQLFEVLALLGIARTLNRTAIFNGDDLLLHSHLDFLYERIPQVAKQVISVPIDYDHPNACCHYHIPRLMACERTKFLLISGSYFQSFKYFSPIEDSIRKWLKPPAEKREKLKVAGNDELRFKTCVHVRRGDFLTDGEHAGTDHAFAINAIDYLYTLNPGLVFLFSNDHKWVRTQLASRLGYQKDVRVMTTPDEEAVTDLYFSQIHCDSVLITAPSSTFGWWMGYFSKNFSNVYYRDIREVDDSTKFQMIDEDFFPAEWKKMRTSRDGRVVVISK